MAGSEATPPSNPHPVRTVAVIVYASFAVLLFVVPGSVAGRLDDFDPIPPVRMAKAAIAAVAQVSDATGIGELYRAARQRFLGASGLQSE